MSRARIRLAVLGDPLRFTLSPRLHQAGLDALGLAGESEALRVPAAELGRRLDDLEGRGYVGVNLTHPHKEAALALIARPSAAARRARSVNTVGFAAEGRWGDTSDGAGFLDFLESRGLGPQAQRVLLLGAGGAARALASALLEAGAASLWVSGRRPAAAGDVAALDPARVEAVAWRSAGERAALARATLLVNATPLGSGAGDELPLPLEDAPRSAVVVDLVYGAQPTGWVRAARARGMMAYDGLGLLVFQARRSLERWLDRPVPLAPLCEAVGWPR